MKQFNKLILIAFLLSQIALAQTTNHNNSEYLWYEAENMRGFGTKPTGEPMQNPESERSHDHRDEARADDLPPRFPVEEKRAAPERDHEVLRENDRGSANTTHYAMHFPASPNKQRPKPMHNGRQHGVEQY